MIPVGGPGRIVDEERAWIANAPRTRNVSAAGDQYEMCLEVGVSLDGFGGSIGSAMRQRNALQDATPARIAEEHVVSELKWLQRHLRTAKSHTHCGNLGRLG